MSAVDEIKQRLDIVEFIGGYVRLQKAGRNFKGLCPFHAEKTPSFIVFPERQGWHCFGACSTGGDIFTFVMKREGLTFPEALRFLAERAGIALGPLDQAELQSKDEQARLRAVNLAAAQYYHRILMETPQGEPARRYLERRGVARETMAAFQLGYAPDEWHALEEYLKRQHHAPQDILAAGLTIQSEGGNVYDRFRGRLMFPIRDMQGHVIGFGGRVLGEGQPKYLNTPETPLFDKGSALYGIELARESIRATGTAIIVEGYMDVIIPHQCGVKNVVACMGTALSDAHLQTLKRLTTKRLILALDADAAGMRAVERGVETAQQGLEHKVVPVLMPRGIIRFEERLDADIRVMVLPEGLDPDELILRDRARWDALVAEALPVVEYFMQTVLREADLSTARGKREAVDRLLGVIAAIDNPVSRAHYLQRLAQRVRVDERQLLPALEALRAGQGKPGAAPPRRSAPPPATDQAKRPAEPGVGLEAHCLALLLYAPNLLSEAREVSGVSAETFQDVRNRQVFEALQAYMGAHAAFDLAEFRLAFDKELDIHVESLLQRLQAGPPLTPAAAREDLLKSLTRLQKGYLAHLIQELRFEQQEPQAQPSEERGRELSRMIEELTREVQQLDQRFNAVTLMGRKHKEFRPR